MTFEGILDQAITMLQRRGRLTYGALKRQFQLDDAYREDLKAELIEGQRLEREGVPQAARPGSQGHRAMKSPSTHRQVPVTYEASATRA